MWRFCALLAFNGALLTADVSRHDRQNGYFKTPVNKAEVPDYYDVIKNPMCWDTIDQKLDRHEYLDLAEFKVRNDSSSLLG